MARHGAASSTDTPKAHHPGGSGKHGRGGDAARRHGGARALGTPSPGKAERARQAALEARLEAEAERDEEGGAGASGGGGGGARRPRMCAFVRMPGGCRNGKACAFCHSVEELKAHPRYKSRPCLAFFSSGKCPQGDECGYYHSEAERREPPPEPAPEVHRPVVPQMCYYADMPGGCHKGASCKFCHNATQMARIFKTRPCDCFWLHGRCDRGQSCGFYHAESERRFVPDDADEEAPSVPVDPAAAAAEAAEREAAYEQQAAAAFAAAASPPLAPATPERPQAPTAGMHAAATSPEAVYVPLAIKLPAARFAAMQLEEADEKEAGRPRSPSPDCPLAAFAEDSDSEEDVPEWAGDVTPMARPLGASLPPAGSNTPASPSVTFSLFKSRAPFQPASPMTPGLRRSGSGLPQYELFRASRFFMEAQAAVTPVQ